MKQPTMYVMCGLPRAGKSTWIKENKADAIIISQDDVRKKIFGHQFVEEANMFVAAITEAMMTLILDQGKDVIIDATHVITNFRAKCYKIAKKCDAKVHVIWVYADKDPQKNLEICIKRSKCSEVGSIVPEEAITRLSDMFQEPKADNLYFEEEIVITEYHNRQIN